MSQIVVITGAGAGVGRAVAEEFARHGWSVALLSRDVTRLNAAAAELVERYGVRTLAIPTDVADANAVEAAADKVERELGPIHTWINVAMATVFGAVSDISAAEVERGTRVTYLGQVHGMMSALKRMRTRNNGVIVNVGSALAYRSVPLQAIYCGAKAAIRGFTDSLRSEIIHDKLDVQLTMVDLPAVNTPQFDWAMNKTGRRPNLYRRSFSPKCRRAPSILRLPTSAAMSGWAGRRSRRSSPTASRLACLIATWPRRDIPANSQTSGNLPTRPPTCSSRC